MRRVPPLVLVSAVAAALALTGCGRKGGLEPPGAPATPAPATTVFGIGAPPPAPEEPKPAGDDDFFLDAII